MSKKSELITENIEEQFFNELDSKRKWKEIKTNFLISYKRKTETAGYFIQENNILGDSEWCVEAYMETDFSNITKDDFEKEMKKYISFKLKNSNIFEVNENE